MFDSTIKKLVPKPGLHSISTMHLKHAMFLGFQSWGSAIWLQRNIECGFRPHTYSEFYYYGSNPS